MTTFWERAVHSVYCARLLLMFINFCACVLYLLVLWDMILVLWDMIVLIPDHCIHNVTCILH